MARVKISNYLKKGNIQFIKSSKKKEALKELFEIINNDPKLEDKNLFKEFLKREKIMSTGIGVGIAIPHIKHSTIKDFVVAIGISKKGIKFDAIDNMPVHIIIMVAAPAHKHSEYLKLLARIVLVLKNNDLRKKIIASKNIDEIYTQFTNA